MSTEPQEWTRAVSLLAIDPGACTGWCILLDVGEQGWHIAAAGVAKPKQMHAIPLQKVDLVVIENPRDYLNEHVPLNALLTLARTVGRYEERFEVLAKRMQLVTPHEWKGSIDPDIMLRRIEAGLSARDKATIANYKIAESYRHNMIDAIGIAYWATRQPWIREPRPKKA